MARVHHGIVAEREQDVSNRRNQGVVIAAGQIHASDRAGEQRIADEQILSNVPRPTNLQTHAARTVAGRVMRAHLVLPKLYDLIRKIELVDGRLRFDPQPEHRARLHGALVQKQVVLVQMDRHVQHTLGRGDAGHVIDMGVRQQDVTNLQRFALDERQQALDLIARIDEDALTRVFAADDEAVLEERSDGLALDYHDAPMILAVLDDLMFTSKIKTAARQLGVDVTFARSADGALAEMRKTTPSLVIFDLNSARTDPLGIVAAMKADSALASVRTVGYASHVMTDLIESARKAGVGEVLARSAFTDRLPQLLKSLKSEVSSLKPEPGTNELES